MKETTTSVDPAIQKILDETTNRMKVAYLSYQQAAANARQTHQPGTARIRYGMAAAIASQLSEHYQASGQMEQATIWGDRAGRMLRIAFQQTNSIARNIGATDHDGM